MENLTGVVIKSTGSFYNVRLSDTNEIVSAKIVGKFRLKDKILTNPVAVGDIVHLRQGQNSEQLLIHKIQDRENMVLRQSPSKKHELHLLASNIDQAVLITTIREPDLKLGFIDRFLLMTSPYRIATAIVFNKADLWEKKDQIKFDILYKIYSKIGYSVISTSTLDCEGLQELKTILKNKTSLLSGQSGVGKSSLINAIEPSIDIITNDISTFTGKGQHTTTFAEMYELSFNAHLIDTPGIKNLSFNNLEPLDVAHNFLEFFEYSQNCKFSSNCLHINEPKCAVKTAIAEHEISSKRYNNYLKIMEEITSQNYWERHKL